MSSDSSEGLFVKELVQFIFLFSSLSKSSLSNSSVSNSSVSNSGVSLDLAF